jgi:very-short-patch-repair endonuclease
MKSSLEQEFEWLLKAHKMPCMEREYRFVPDRRWRFDFAYIDQMIAIELEGGTWCGGRHTRGAGYEKDLEKYNRATIEGWKVLRYTSGTMVNAIDDLKKLLCVK